jgi:hypothetical protein
MIYSSLKLTRERLIVIKIRLAFFSPFALEKPHSSTQKNIGISQATPHSTTIFSLHENDFILMTAPPI